MKQTAFAGTVALLASMACSATALAQFPPPSALPSSGVQPAAPPPAAAQPAPPPATAPPAPEPAPPAPEPAPAPPAAAPEGTTQVGAGADPGNLPPPQSDNDARPTPPTPITAASGITEQAGIGGTQAYARAGVLELGGSAGLAVANSFVNVNISPSIGYFPINNLQVSAIVGFNYASAQVGNVTTSTTYLTALVEPSLHIAFTDSLYGFAGVGAGLSYIDGPGAGFAVAPRLGLNVLVGRSGILTPALNLVYATTDAVTTAQGTRVEVNTVFGLNVGYTVMW